MNFTFEIANETILAVAEVCNICNFTLLNQVKNEILSDFARKIVIANTVTVVISGGLFMAGWFLAGWFSRKYVIAHKHRTLVAEKKWVHEGNGKKNG